MKRLTITALLAAALSMPAHAFDYFNLGESPNAKTNTELNIPKKNVKLGLYSPDMPDGAIVDALPPIHEPIDPIKVKRSIAERKKVEPALAACEAAKSLTLREVFPPDVNMCVRTKLTYYIPIWNNEASNCVWEENTSKDDVACPTKESDVIY